MNVARSAEPLALTESDHRSRTSKAAESLNLIARALPTTVCAVAAAAAFATLLWPTPATSQKAPASRVQGAPLTLRDGRIQVRIDARSAPGVTCSARAAHLTKHSKHPLTESLDTVTTGKYGLGRWTFIVAEGLPAGSWKVRVSCELDGSNIPAEPYPYVFYAATAPGDRRYSTGLIEPGTLENDPVNPPGSPNAGSG